MSDKWDVIDKPKISAHPWLAFRIFHGAPDALSAAAWPKHQNHSAVLLALPFAGSYAGGLSWENLVIAHARFTAFKRATFYSKVDLSLVAWD